ncbi:MAG: dihydroxyacetone kinase ADP-binding subunit DhaL [Chloroflexi bacterium]|nr:dihydroxyacetone kinase ADP-binding subunit DhaL [Chloroflexota bacterium]MCI0575331.1 dihydroxyacetone kinase ADP-binding subunit DhaL [Chloroflexota bacterium]MCI0647322.1 dihydroxyacetone kinase ADP-binding subunit DhaL [Chloroflexota bacterium]MCI0725793.1 dihydroxyacetone kinase ADP-binding subunit DhaL [Chloroflexota bacterium]
MVTKAQIVQWLEATAAVLSQNKEYLTQLDAAIGDADHGINMNRGFKKIMEKLPSVADKDIGNILKTAGMTLLSSVGGASGPLYGTFFTRAGMAMTAKEELSDEDLLKLLEAAVDGILQRGRPQPGDKTMYDALAPALAALRAALAEGQDTVTALQAAVNGAEQGMKETIPMQARKGRASYMGERSIGHQDPGATSSYLILNALLETLAS